MKTITLPAESSKVGTLTKVSSCGFERLEPSAAAARQSVTDAIQQQISNSHTRCYRWASDGTMFVLYYSDGWQYDIVGESHKAQGCPCTCTVGQPDFGPATFHHAREIMERHVFGYCGQRSAEHVA